MVETEVVPVAAEVTKNGAGQQILHSLGTAKSTAMAHAAAHPVAAVVIGAVVLTIGAYYIGKFVGGRRARRKAQAAA